MPKYPKRLPKLQPVPGWPGFFATATGKVYSVRELSPVSHNDGYLRASIKRGLGGKILRPGIHRLVCLAFHGSPPKRFKSPEARHINGERRDNRACNLAWGDRQSNARDMAKHGSVRGRKNPKAILNERQVRQIKQRLRTGTPHSVLASKYGVSKSTIQAINSGRNWKHA